MKNNILERKLSFSNKECDKISYDCKKELNFFVDSVQTDIDHKNFKPKNYVISKNESQIIQNEIYETINNETIYEKNSFTPKKIETYQKNIYSNTKIKNNIENITENTKITNDNNLYEEENESNEEIIEDSNIEINKEITQLTKLNYELENKQIELENHKIIIIATKSLKKIKNTISKITKKIKHYKKKIDKLINEIKIQEFNNSNLQKEISNCRLEIKKYEEKLELEKQKNNEILDQIYEKTLELNNLKSLEFEKPQKTENNDDESNEILNLKKIKERKKELKEQKRLLILLNKKKKEEIEYEKISIENHKLPEIIMKIDLLQKENKYIEQEIDILKEKIEKSDNIKVQLDDYEYLNEQYKLKNRELKYLISQDNKKLKFVNVYNEKIIKIPEDKIIEKPINKIVEVQKGYIQRDLAIIKDKTILFQIEKEINCNNELLNHKTIEYNTLLNENNQIELEIRENKSRWINFKYEGEGMLEEIKRIQNEIYKIEKKKLLNS